MRAMQVVQQDGRATLIAADVPEPRPGTGEVLVRVCAAGATPTELGWYPTTHTKAGGDRDRAIPGHEFSGVVEQVGEGVTAFTVGGQVFGMNDWFADGATADFCLTRPEWIATKPARLTHQQAATVPIGALTASQGLLTKAKLQSGERVLVHGGAGAVGLFAVQLAVLHAATVIATTSGATAGLVQQLGASEVIDYERSRFEDQVRDIDVVFDTVGRDTLERSWQVLRAGGRLVTIASDAESATDPRVKDAFFIVEPNGRELAEIAELLDSGRLRTFVNAAVPFSQAPLAYANAIREKRGYGKVVVAVDPGAPVGP